MTLATKSPNPGHFGHIAPLTKDILFYSVIGCISLLITYLFLLIAITDSFFFITFAILILGLSAPALSFRLLYYTDFVFDSNGITYSPYMSLDKRIFHAWRDVVKCKVNASGIFMRFADMRFGDRGLFNLLIMSEEIRKKIEDICSLYLGKEIEVSREDKNKMAIGPIQDDMCTIVDSATLKAIFVSIGLIILIFFLTEKNLIHVYMSESFILIFTAYLLFVIRTQ